MVHLKTTYRGIAKGIHNDNGIYSFFNSTSEHVLTITQRQGNGFVGTLVSVVNETLTFFVLPNNLIAGQGYEEDQTPFNITGNIDHCKLYLVLAKADKIVELILH